MSVCLCDALLREPLDINHIGPVSSVAVTGLLLLTLHTYVLNPALFCLLFSFFIPVFVCVLLLFVAVVVLVAGSPLRSQL